MSEHCFNELTTAFAFYTECQLATVEHMEMVKSTSKSALARQRGIADGMVEHCRRLEVKLPLHQTFPRIPRLRKLLSAQHDPTTPSGAAAGCATRDRG